MLISGVAAKFLFRRRTGFSVPIGGDCPSGPGTGLSTPGASEYCNGKFASMIASSANGAGPSLVSDCIKLMASGPSRLLSLLIVISWNGTPLGKCDPKPVMSATFGCRARSAIVGLAESPTVQFASPSLPSEVQSWPGLQYHASLSDVA